MSQCSVITVGHIATDHIAALEGLHGEVTVDRRCADLAELLAVVYVMRADAVLIIGQTEHISRSVYDQLAGSGVRIVVISDVAGERERIASLGATVCPDDVSPEELARHLSVSSDTSAVETSTGDFDELVHAQGWNPKEESFGEPALDAPAESEVTVVWGACGSPGRTTVALNMAAEYALSGESTVLIDADTYAASVAVHCGLMQESAGIAQACRSAEMGRLDTASLRETVTSLEIDSWHCDVITGLPRPQRWTELRAAAFRTLLTVARTRYQRIVIDVAPWVEEDHSFAFDPARAQRNGCTLEALQYADRILAVGGADPVGFSRTVKAVQELHDVLPEAVAPEVVINGVRKSVIGRSPRRQLEDAWQSVDLAPTIEAFLPWDQEAADAALRSGEVLAEAAPQSDLRRSIASLAGISIPAPTRRRSRAARSARRSDSPVDSTTG